MAKKKRKQPTHWTGPEKYGISFSHLNRFLECPERMYIYSMEGLAEDQEYNFAREYGTLFHGAEEFHSMGKNYRKGVDEAALQLREQYPTATDEIVDAAAWAKLQYGEYLRHYAASRERKKRNYVLAERRFRVPYSLPCGRTVYLRGIIDGGYTFQEGNRTRFYIQENKTKGKIYEQGITKGLTRDMQSMFYVLVARKLKGLPPVNGILYNVIRRPLSERWAPRQKKKETKAAFRKRYQVEYLQARAKEYFYEFPIPLFQKTIREFRKEVFDPILTRLCVWYDWVSQYPDKRFEEPHGLHFQAPFGCYNSLANGWEGSYFQYLTSGRQNTRGLSRFTWRQE